MTQLSLSNIVVSFGATTILEDVTFTVAAGEKWGVIGRNGAGSLSSLLRSGSAVVAAGLLPHMVILW